MKSSKKVDRESYMSVAQSCESRKCRKKFKHQIVKDISENVVTPHKFYSDKNEIHCIYCGRITKL